MMTKKDFIALADAIKQSKNISWTPKHLEILADFCEAQNGQFKRERWIEYIRGTNGPSGGIILRSDGE